MYECSVFTIILFPVRYSYVERVEAEVPRTILGTTRPLGRVSTGSVPVSRRL